jgi:IS30 family transposase
VSILGVGMSVGRVRGKRLSRDERLLVRGLIASGASFEQAARAASCTPRTVARLLNSVGGIGPREKGRSALRLSLAEREEISIGLRTGQSLAVIARRLKRAPSTISREISNNGGRRRYRAAAADRAADRRARRPKVAKLAHRSRLRDEVESMLDLRWSPQQISARLVIEFPDDLSMRVSHETIYQSLFVQSRGALRKELAACLRTGRTRRRPHGRKNLRGQIKDMVVISQRPAEIEDRAVPGHWEGDLIVGAHGTSAIVTLVERQTRYVLLGRIGTDKSTLAVCAAIAAQIQTLPEHLAKSLTWDRGKELAGHAHFTVATGIDVYFCDPHSPWQRGSNENTNGLLRQYFPKSSDLSLHDQQQLDEVAYSLNNRPRQTLDWAKPSEKLTQLLAITT